jgi:thiol-disulfide isomerase/thioredoxin
LFIVALLFVGAVLLGWQEVMEGKLLKRGSPAPDFTVKTLAGAPVTLSALKGKVVLVDFWATWCGPCREEMPYLVSTVQSYAAQGVTLVAVSNDDLDEQAAAVEAFTGQLPGLRPYAAYGTPELGATYLVRALPTLYVIDRQGNVSQTQTGQASERQLRRWIDAALEQ